MLGKLGHQHMCQPPNSRDAELDRTARSRCLHDGIGATVGQLRTYVLNDMEASGNDLELLGHVSQGFAHALSMLSADSCK